MKVEKVRFYLKLAETTSSQSTCPRAKVGAVLVQDNRVVALGYNGAPRGIPHCGCWVYPRGKQKSCLLAVHAELNALLNAAHGGTSTKGAFMFCTHSPCLDCLKACINAGVVRIYYHKKYEDPLARKLYLQAGCQVSLIHVIF